MAIFSPILALGVESCLDSLIRVQCLSATVGHNLIVMHLTGGPAQLHCGQALMRLLVVLLRQHREEEEPAVVEKKARSEPALTPSMCGVHACRL